EEIVRDVIEARRKSGQLNESNLTLNDLQKIYTIFVEMLQAVFHPRINYAEAVARVRKPTSTPTPTTTAEMVATPIKETNGDKRLTGEIPVITPKTATSLPKVVVPVKDDDDGDAPLLEVPRLKKADENGKPTEKKEEKNTNDIH
ncbi:MAG TPA: hypothetical protein PLZ51_19605, partial [Aggregatilineales bacterium]|nr:hypothetical protein [Aggregatilineales bacterium]